MVRGCRPRTPAFRCDRVVSHPARYRGLRSGWQVGATAPATRFPLRSACLADGSLPRATTRLAGRGCRPHNPAFRCDRFVLQATRYRGQRSALQVGARPHTPAFRGVSCRRLAFSGHEALCRWGCRPHTPAFRCRRLVLQATRYRGTRDALLVGAGALTPPLSAACLTEGSLSRATKRLAGGGC
jgi:hypothetical protein